jgi:hypothetical protein
MPFAALICRVLVSNDELRAMQDDPSNTLRPPAPRFALLRVPLFRLLAINLAIGACAAALLVGGLLLVNPGGLRDLIFADRAPGVAIGVLLGSFFVTFGSVAMGTAIMALGRSEGKDGGPRGGRQAPAMQALTSRKR